ncbi:MAG TPA: alpha/beta hydrolase [Thermoplasmata archaeon]|nr:alpha/beta hydrolase [Thermoplasmata archaeon]
MARLRRVTTAGRRSFEYIARGEGRATLLVHPGGPGYTYHYLRPLLRLATSHLRVILFNPRGVGGSWGPRQSDDYTVQNQAQDVEAIRRALDIDELHLLGFSAGGFAALEYARRYQRKLTSLLLCATAGSAEEVRQANRLMLTAATRGQRRRLAELTRAKAFDSKEYVELATAINAPFSSRFLTGVPKDLKASKVSRKVYRAMMTRTGDEFVVDGTMARWDGRRYYSKIEVPTLVLVGRYDFFFEASREMADRIVPAHLRVLPHSSHLAHLEQPREFLNALREFLLDVTGD